MQTITIKYKFNQNYCSLISKENARLFEKKTIKNKNIMQSLETQIGGSHYQGFKIQPAEFIGKNELNFFEGNVIKYVCRYKAKNGIEDLEKAQHYLAMLIDLERSKQRPQALREIQERAIKTPNNNNDK